MPASAFAREYENVFDSLEARFFDADAIAAAFGAVVSPTPPLPDGDPDPDHHPHPGVRRRGRSFA